MAKIETVVYGCHECKFSKQYVEEGGNTSYVLICNYLELTENESSKHRETDTKGKLFLAEHHNKIKNSISVDIPKECPLEDYKIPNTIHL